MPLLDFFKLADLVPLLLLIGLLEAVGCQVEGDPKTRWGARGTAAAGFLIYAIAGIAAWRPDTAWDFVELVMRAALAMGTAHGLARIVLPTAVFLYRKLWAEPQKHRIELAKEKARQDAENERAARDAAEKEEERRRLAEQERRRREEIASRPPPPTPEEQMEAAKKKYEGVRHRLEAASLDPVELQAALENARQQYLREIDGAMR